MSFKIHILIAILLLLVSCNKYSNETEKLNNVLKMYNRSISQSPNLYIVRSDFYCEGCVQSIFTQLKSISSANEARFITVISSDKKNIIKLPNSLFIMDSQDLIDREFGSITNLCIFETKNGKVINFKNIKDTKDINLPDFAINYFF